MPHKSLSIKSHPSLPFRSSNLAIPPSPFTPLTPLPLPHVPHRPAQSSSPSGTSKRISHLPPPPKKPLKWVWQCHICHRQYKLGVTRRCLDDGHYFCSGATVTKRHGGRRVKKHQPCGSEFDYSGWKVWDTWRRAIRAQLDAETATPSSFSSSPSASIGDTQMYDADSEEEFLTQSVVSPLFGSLAAQQQTQTRWFKSKNPNTAPILVVPRVEEQKKKNCWDDCDYPSECRWGKAYGVSTPASATFSFLTTSITSPLTSTAGVSYSGEENMTKPATDFRDILTREQQNVADTIDGVSESRTGGVSAFTDLAGLVKSAQRRKSRSDGVGSSPLAASTPLSSSSSPSRSSSPEIEMEDDCVPAFGSPLTRSGSKFTELDLEHTNVDQAKAGKEEENSTEASRPSSIAKAFDDFELDFRKSMEKAGGILSSMVGAVRGSMVASESPDSTAGDLEKKFHKQLRIGSGAKGWKGGN